MSNYALIKGFVILVLPSIQPKSTNLPKENIMVRTQLLQTK